MDNPTQFDQGGEILPLSPKTTNSLNPPQIPFSKLKNYY
ncbi:hypothetical protein LEP1GSC199_1746 [Leptospira vanthielii serovar Holland str. Waz Holland = ATCC 700522]|uniref:Uncharacterized protein n=1 Tax=Leptospira vanthielii serovar Holland str. Waz Holland = ATCC 700522 TaxID=1218591 RepID=N1W9Y1_9LEPT|nr:hypothetical protein LEP1GSC199_1746 [Leptospira vanthielii serovar Holland str. Waz Holland = ATCC 700522]